MEDQAYLSFIEQTMHYFHRHHEKAVVQTIVSPAAWCGGELPPLEEMAYSLSGPETDELGAAIAGAIATGTPARALTAQDFPLPRLAPRIE